MAKYDLVRRAIKDIHRMKSAAITSITLNISQ